MNADLDLAGLEALLEAADLGTLRRVTLGGHSTVLASKAHHHGPRVRYGYTEDGDQCIAEPFITTASVDEPSDTRLDFVSFRHDTAALIVAAVNALPTLLSRHKEMREALEPFAAIADERDRWLASGSTSPDSDLTLHYGKALVTMPDFRRARTALTKDAPHVR